MKREKEIQKIVSDLYRNKPTKNWVLDIIKQKVEKWTDKDLVEYWE